MTNYSLLRATIMENGLTMGELAYAIGMSKQSLSMKANNIRTFDAKEISDIQKQLNISNEKRDQIFFAEKVD